MMADPWVENVQTWLNETYTGVPGWNPVVVNGQTGWPTMYALTRALQHELGLSSLSDNFGPGTLAALSNLGDVGPGSDSNIVRIVQGGMYCKGYNGGNGLLDGVYSSTTVAGVQQMRTDIGISAGQGTISPKLFKALLTMDAYILVAGGSSTIRQIQRDLNSRYLNRLDFYVIPSDGFYSRDVQRGLMLALQYEIGMADGVANGNFGPGTRAGLTDHANFGLGDTDGASGKFFIHLFQAALIFNGFPSAYNGSFNSSTVTITTSFQEFCILATTGRSDFQTWASLLVSTGDTTRVGRAADTITTITSERAATLVGAGYETIGRYLTNTPGGSLDKNLEPGELATILGAGMTVFPIYQEGNTGTDFFNYSEGYRAGQRAHDAAWDYGFRPGTIVYFAVDFDALEWEVFAYVVHYFRGVRDGLGSRLSQYRVGIYGSRNTCSIVSAAGLADLSFVSGMSTGFSGNLGFPLPANWAFDQILEYEIGSGTGRVNIDKDVKSGRDLGQNSVIVNPTPPLLSDKEKALAYIYRVQGLANEYSANVDGSIDAANLTARYLRQRYYSGLDWTVLGGINSTAFYAYVDSEIPSSEIPLAFATMPATPVDGFDWPHMLATFSAYLYRGPSSSSDGPEFSDIGGWGGDLATLARNFAAQTALSAYDFATDAFEGTIASSFSPPDFAGDIAAWVAAYSYQMSPTTTVADAIRTAVNGSTFSTENTFDSFIRLRFGTMSQGLSIAQQAYEQPGDTTDRLLFNASRTYLLQSASMVDPPVLIADFDVDDLRSIARAFVNRAANLSTHYSPIL